MKNDIYGDKTFKQSVDLLGEINEEETEWFQFCPKSKDGNGHCDHWWDEGQCCWCKIR